ncbi:IS3 family transposase [Actinomadura litoris]|uniref:IS3 family transposase n=1 Tax=Actinomadura litoris TaxID=2678616 RepID=UPI001FA7208A|nr:IS3 family transposase [Actinomadura litoris]
MSAPRKYPQELRDRAVRLAMGSDRPIAQIAADLGIHRQALRTWVRQAQADAGQRSEQLTSAEREELKRLRKENNELKRANEILKAASALFAAELGQPRTKWSWWSTTCVTASGPVPVCRVLDLCPGTCYGRKRRPPSARAQRDAVLIEQIRDVHQASYGTYGAYRVHRQLRRQGVRVARCTVETLMRTHGLQGVHRRDRQRTTTPDEAVPRPPDLVNRRFTTDRPDHLWLADITYVRTWEGWVYVAFVLDAFSRRIVGWQLADHLRTDLPLDALEMALWQRGRERPVQPGTLIHHSDRGCQYVSFRYTTRLADLGVTASVGSVADSYDNAMAESLNATFKTELIHRRTWRTRDQVEYAIVEWVGWYNHHRLHTAIGDVPPIEHETAYYRSVNTPAPTGAR